MNSNRTHQIGRLSLIILCMQFPTNTVASYAGEVFACRWSDESYIMLEAMIPRTGEGNYNLYKLKKDGKIRVYQFNDKSLKRLSNWNYHTQGNTKPHMLSDVYYFSDRENHFLIHLINDLQGLKGLVNLKLPTFNTKGFKETECILCDQPNNYCRNLFK